jgi:hypothetical protein
LGSHILIASSIRSKFYFVIIFSGIMLFIGVFLSVEMWHGKLGKNVGRGRVKSHIKLSSPSRSLHDMRTYVLLPRAVRWRSVQVWNHLIDFLPTNYPTRSAFNRVSCPSIFNSVSTQSWLTCPNSVHRTVHVPVFRPVFLMGSDTHGSLSPYHRPGYRAPRRSSPISTYSSSSALLVGKPYFSPGLHYAFRVSFLIPSCKGQGSTRCLLLIKKYTRDSLQPLQTS